MPEAFSPSANNPCSHKLVCRQCRLVDDNEMDRPLMCIRLKCEHYTPCVNCQQNKKLNVDQLCEQCGGKAGKRAVRGDNGALVIEDTSPVQEVGAVGLPLMPEASKKVSSGKSTREIEVLITPPGTPPTTYTQGEKDLYNAQWLEYVGFFRDPSAYPICHTLIQLEIELNWITTACIQLRTDPEMQSVLKELESRQGRLLSNIESLRKQLPSKEAQELTDDEQAISMIYERYTEQKRGEYAGGVSRMLSPEATALAPVMPYRINPRELLERCGYSPIAINDALDRIIDNKDLPEDPAKLLEFFGFRLKEKFALQKPSPVKVENASVQPWNDQ